MVVADLSDQPDQTQGFNYMLGCVRDTWDDADPWGSNIAWMFSIADVYYVSTGEALPGFRPSPALHSVDGLDRDDYATDVLLMEYENACLSTREMRELFMFLNGLDDKFREMGLNY